MHLSLRSKLLGGFGAGALLLGAVGLAGWQSTNTATAGLQTLYHDEAAASAALRNTGRALLELRNGALSGSYANVDQPKRDKMLADDAKWFKTIDDSISEYAGTHLSDDEAQALTEWKAAYPPFLELRKEVIHQMDEIIKDPNAPYDTSAFRSSKTNPALSKVISITDRLIELHKVGSTEAYNRTLATAQQGQLVLLVFVLLGVVVLLGTSVLIIRNVLHNLRKVRRVLTALTDADALSMEAGLKAMAHGDLTVQAHTTTVPIKRPSADEIGQLGALANRLLSSVHGTIGSYELARASLGEMISDVQCLAGVAAVTVTHMSSAAAQTGGVVQQVTQAVQSVAAGAANTSHSAQETNAAVGQLRQAVEGIARGAGEQAREVHAASATATEMADGIQQVAADATRVAGESQQTKQAAERGAQAVTQTIAGMAEISIVVSQAADKVRALGDLGTRIGAVVETIDDIAEQTNLLALNAAIEAARAGEHGRGFAVVADEVRKLAERSSRETKQIAELIRQVQSGTRDAVAAMQTGATRVEQGSIQADEAGQALGEIMSAVDSTVDQITEIATAAQEMAGGARSVVQTMLGIQAVVEENTAATEQMASQSGQVAEAIQEIAAVAEEQSASTEEVSASAEEMTAQIEEMSAQAQELAGTAEQLRQLVERFHLAAAEAEAHEEHDEGDQEVTLALAA